MVDASTMVALLRGVNLGPSKKVPMAELKAVALALGLEQPATLLNSGNLVYRSRTLSGHEAQEALRAAIGKRIGVDCNVIVRTRAQLAAILEANPLMNEARENPSRLLVTVWDDQVTPTMLESLANAPVTRERFVVGALAAYLWFPDGISASTVYDKAARPLGEHITARNWNTMEKLLAMMTS